MLAMEEPAPKPKKTRIPDAFTHVDENILQCIFRYYYMTVVQVVKALGYSKNSLPTVRTRLAHLEQQGYIAAIYLPTTRKGNFPKVFFSPPLALTTSVHKGAMCQSGIIQPSRKRSSTYS